MVTGLKGKIEYGMEICQRNQWPNYSKNLYQWIMTATMSCDQNFVLLFFECKP